MSRGPRRLMDDPDFQWETGCNLRDESALVEGYDLGGLREAVLARLPEVGDGVPPIRPRRGWRWGVGGLVGLSTVTAFWLGTQFAGVGAPVITPEAPPAATQETPPVAPVRPEVAEPVPEPIEARAIEAPAEVVPDVPEPIVRRVTRPVATPVAEPIDDAGSAEDPTDAVAEAVPEPERAPSRLAAEMAVYEPAADALAAGDASVAAVGFRSYLAKFPEGTLRVEAELGLLWALHQLGDAARTERWAAALVDRPAHAKDRDDIRELQAQALVRLGRCEDALEAVDGLPSRVVGPIRRACRRR